MKGFLCQYLFWLQWNIDNMNLALFHAKYDTKSCHIPEVQIWKILAQNCKYFLTHQFKHVFWVFKRTVSMRQFFWVPTTYVLVGKWGKIKNKYRSYLWAPLIHNLCRASFKFCLYLFIKYLEFWHIRVDSRIFPEGANSPLVFPKGGQPSNQMGNGVF